MKCVDDLTQDHKVILRALDVLEEMAFTLEGNRRVDPIDVTAILHFLRRFADEYHQTKEESALFPLLRRTIRNREDAVLHMLFEHDQERSLIEALQEALNTKAGEQFGIYSHRLAALVRNHVEKEDRILFAIVAATLTPEQDDGVTEELHKFQLDEKLLPELRRLEWKYLRKSAAC